MVTEGKEKTENGAMSLSKQRTWNRGRREVRAF